MLSVLPSLMKSGLKTGLKKLIIFFQKIIFKNQNIILNSGKAILGSDNIIEFFNPVKYIIKNENNENKYEINSENAYYNLSTKSVSFKAKDKRVKSIIYF